MKIDISNLYIPSFYGDIRLEKRPIDDVEHTRVIVERSTQRERVALDNLRNLALKKSWLSKKEEATFQAIITGSDASVWLKAPLGTVTKELTRLLKPGRKLVNVALFQSAGEIEPVLTELSEDLEPLAPASSATPASSLLDRAVDAVKSAAETVAEAVSPTVQAAASVAAPSQGCPASIFQRAEAKATEVLLAFLDDEQKEDFKKQGAFVVHGAVTGHRYLVVSRNRPDMVRRCDSRQFFDLDDKRGFCVHDWTVPVAEEMLALALLAQLPRHELYLRHLEH